MLEIIVCSPQANALTFLTQLVFSVAGHNLGDIDHDRFLFDA